MCPARCLIQSLLLSEFMPLLLLEAPWTSQSSLPRLLFHRLGMGAGEWLSECPREGNQVCPPFKPLESYLQLVGGISKC